MAEARSRAEALERFFGLLDRHEERIRRSRAKVDSIYAFRTPAICGEAWRNMADALGPIYLHTCGPASQALEMIAKLPGIAGMETAYVDGRHARTGDVRAARERTRGKLVFSTFGLPHGEPLEDREALTRKWLDEMSEGGGHMLHAWGRLEEGRRLLARLGIA